MFDHEEQFIRHSLPLKRKKLNELEVPRYGVTVHDRRWL